MAANRPGADLLAIVDYISDHNPGRPAAERRYRGQSGKAAKLAEHPKLYRPGRVAGTRGNDKRLDSDYKLVCMPFEDVAKVLAFFK
jgi:hypothetical protein